MSLSVTAKSNVLVTSCVVGKLIEFTTNGRVLREIDLGRVSVPVFHSVQLSNGQFVVATVFEKCVYMIKDDGEPVQSYSGQIGPYAGQLLNPRQLVVDKQGFVAVVANISGNVVLLSPSLTYVRELVTVDKGLAKYPFRMCFNEKRSLLFVAGIDDGLSVFKGETRI